MKKLVSKIKLDNLLIILSCVFLGTLFIIYFCRFIYFYRQDHSKLKIADKTVFSEYLINNDFLQEKKNKDKHIYKDVNNYVSYSGMMFRIVSIDKGNIKLVTEDNMTSLVMSYDNLDYKNTYTNIWLNESFINNLKDYDKLLVKTNTCIDILDSYENAKCQKYFKDNYVGLLSIDEYLEAGANNSYLNNNSYYWLSNKNDAGNYWYVYDVGGLSDKSKTEVTYHSYGVRPTITLSKKTILLSGSGTKNDPYIILNNDNKLLVNRDLYEYVKYNNYLWRIIGHDNDNNVKLVMDAKIDTELTYSDSNSNYLNSNIYNYLNNEFYNSLVNREYIVNHVWSNGLYNKDTLYNYQTLNSEEVEAYIGLLNIGDLSLYDSDNYFMMTRSTTNMEYSMQNNMPFVDLVSKSLDIRPVIYLKGTLKVKGKGTKKDPFVIEGE